MAMTLIIAGGMLLFLLASILRRFAPLGGSRAKVVGTVLLIVILVYIAWLAVMVLMVGPAMR